MGTTSTSRTESTTLQKQMAGWAIERFGDLRRDRALLSLETLPVSKVEKHDVLIRMYGAEIGDWDALVASGEWPVERPFPIVCLVERGEAPERFGRNAYLERVARDLRMEGNLGEAERVARAVFRHVAGQHIPAALFEHVMSQLPRELSDISALP